MGTAVLNGNTREHSLRQRTPAASFQKFSEFFSFKFRVMSKKRFRFNYLKFKEDKKELPAGIEDRIIELRRRFNYLSFNSQISEAQSGNLAKELRQIFSDAGVALRKDTINVTIGPDAKKPKAVTIKFNYSGREVMEIVMEPGKYAARSCIFATGKSESAPEATHGFLFLSSPIVADILKAFLAQKRQ